TGGTPGYNYLWSNGSHSASPTGLGAGGYGVVVTDAHGCITSGSYTVTQPTAIRITGTAVNVTGCNANKNGSITTSVSGGTPGYNYSWSNGAHTPGLTGLGAGTY